MRPWKNPFVLLFLFYCNTIATIATVEQLYSAVISKDTIIEVFATFGSGGQMWATKEWIEADTFMSASSFNPERKSLDEIEIRTGFLNWVDYLTITSPPMLWWRHSSYWVNVLPQKTTFNVLYFDPFGTLPSAGYPKVDYRIKGESNFSSLILNFKEESDGGRIYTGEVSLSTGVYEYQYAVRNPNRPQEEYRLSLSSFVVSRQPSNFENSGIADNQSVATAKIVLSWSAIDPDFMGTLYYKVYLGTTTSLMSLIYEGYATLYEVNSLDYGRDYFWQVEAINIYGVSSKSPVWRFKTIAALKPGKAFNYPNPFDPNTGAGTRIVFDMAQVGSAEVSVYTELGDLCWRKSYEGLVAGANEITYDGRDDSGRILYSGPYVVIINKRYSLDGSQSRDRLRLLIIK